MSDVRAIPMHVHSVELAGLGATIIAALPRSLTPSAEVRDSVVALDGGSGWVDQLAATVRDGAIGAYVELPRPIDLSESDSLRRSADTIPVVLRRPYLANPLLTLPRAGWPDTRQAVSVATEQFVRPGSDLAAALADHLAVVRTAVGQVESFRCLVSRDQGYSVTARLQSGADLVMGGIVSRIEPPRVLLTLLAPPERFRLEIPTDETSRPATATVTGLIGELALPTSYESVHRSTWRRVLHAVNNPSSVTDATEFLSDLTTLEKLSKVVS